MNIKTSLDKPFWAMHLNMATNNLLAVVQHLEKHFPSKNQAASTSELETDSQLQDDDVRPILNSSIVRQLKNNKTPADTQCKIIRALLRRLPFLRIAQEFNETPPKLNSDVEDKAKEQERITRIEKEAEHALSSKGVAEALCYYAELLYSLRNYFTHAFHVPAAFRILDKNGNDKYPNRIGEFLHNFDRTWTWNLRKIRQRFGYEDNTMIHLRKKVGKNNNPQFVCQIFEKDEDNNTNNVSVFTERGLAFFAAQFLEPKYVALMFAQLKQPEGKNTVKALATLKAYQTSCIRLPKVRMETAEETTLQTLGMDTLVELHKCPDELYSLLSPENRHLFRIDSGEEKNPEDELFFKRYGNRFTYLALNYLDRAEKFTSMRFHIDLGNYFFDCYPKGLVDGTTLDERRLGKRIKTFQRIQEVEEDYRKNRCTSETLYWQAVPNETPPREYRQDMLPQHRCKKGNIGIYFSSLHKGFPKITLNGKQTHNPKADCFLSLDELPFLTFLAIHGKAKEAQDHLVKIRQDW
ncbi:MAG: type VI-B CRISPR-associated RNA-guided ribonuclease Cas13b, partial [Planctomycetaceae bacterium]|nr:type VI-B CRISPR-associated RNA-guided ribonuclease Cas13b [Planctomycetaceae bacterium]